MRGTHGGRSEKYTGSRKAVGGWVYMGYRNTKIKNKYREKKIKSTPNPRFKVPPWVGTPRFKVMSQKNSSALSVLRHSNQ